MMESLTELVGSINTVLWGKYMLCLILGVGLFLTIGLRFVTLRKLPYAFRQLVSGRSKGKGQISPFQALMTSAPQL